MGARVVLFLLKDSRLRWPSSASVSGLRYKKIDRDGWWGGHDVGGVTGIIS